MNSGNAAVQQHKKLLRNHHIKLKTHIIFLSTYVRNRLTLHVNVSLQTKKLRMTFVLNYLMINCIVFTEQLIFQCKSTCKTSKSTTWPTLYENPTNQPFNE